MRAMINTRSKTVAQHLQWETHLKCKKAQARHKTVLTDVPRAEALYTSATTLRLRLRLTLGLHRVREHLVEQLHVIPMAVATLKPRPCRQPIDKKLLSLDNVRREVQSLDKLLAAVKSSPNLFRYILSQ